jgi:hypothetical protein
MQSTNAYSKTETDLAMQEALVVFRPDPRRRLPQQQGERI